MLFLSQKCYNCLSNASAASHSESTITGLVYKLLHTAHSGNFGHVEKSNKNIIKKPEGFWEVRFFYQ